MFTLRIAFGVSTSADSLAGESAATHPADAELNFPAGNRVYDLLALGRAAEIESLDIQN